MDDLTFRRRVYEDPDKLDQEILDAAAKDPKKRLFLQQTRQMNEQLKSAVNVPVPDELAHKLIWQQSTDHFLQHKRKQRWYVGLAASVALVTGISATMWFMRSPTQLHDHALAHVTHLSKEIPRAGYQENMEQVNAKLASFGGTMKQPVGDIKVANFCHLQLTRSLHLILDTPTGLVSVFVVSPGSDEQVPDKFENQIYQGKSFYQQKARILVVGDKRANLEPLTQKLKENMVFSA